MNILIAMDSFKGSLSSQQLAKIIDTKLQKTFAQKKQKLTTNIFLMADGGEGTCDAFLNIAGGRKIFCKVRGPLGKSRRGYYVILKNKTAVIEIAQSSGLPLVPQQHQNPELTSSFGMGQMINDALQKGCREFIIGLGGSSTNDAGIGILEALGYQFKLNSNPEISRRGLTGIHLSSIQEIIADNRNPLLADSHFTLACDVSNPFYGPKGAAFTYAKQKGADAPMIQRLDAGLRHFAKIIKQSSHVDVQKIPGSGAAGGIGGSLGALLNATNESGFDLLARHASLDKMIQASDLVITGEGRLDNQTLYGKGPGNIVKMAKEYNKKTLGIFGSIPQKLSSYYSHFDACFSISHGPMSLKESMEAKNTTVMLANTIESLFRILA